MHHYISKSFKNTYITLKCVPTLATNVSPVGRNFISNEMKKSCYDVQEWSKGDNIKFKAQFLHINSILAWVKEILITKSHKHKIPKHVIMLHLECYKTTLKYSEKQSTLTLHNSNTHNKRRKDVFKIQPPLHHPLQASQTAAGFDPLTRLLCTLHQDQILQSLSYLHS